jgi:hypothetical protein
LSLAALIFIGSPTSANEVPIHLRLGWSQFQPVISIRDSKDTKLQVSYDAQGRFYSADVPAGTQAIWVIISYGQQGPRAPESFRFRLTPRESTVELSIPRPPPLPGCNQPALDRIGHPQADHGAAFWYVLEARELLVRTTTQNGFCGKVMRSRMYDVLHARQQDMAHDFANISIPLFQEPF